MAGFIRAQPGRVVFDELLASAISIGSGITGYTAKQPAIRYLSWSAPLPPSSSARVMAATISSSNATVTVGSSGLLSNPDYPRVVRLIPSTSQAATGNVVVNGTDVWGGTIADTIALGGTGAAVNGVKAFKTVTSVVLPASTSGTGAQAAFSLTIGLSNVFGVDRTVFSVLSCIRGAVNGTAETTAPIMNVANSTASFTTSATSSTGALLELAYLQADLTHA